MLPDTLYYGKVAMSRNLPWAEAHSPAERNDEPPSRKRVKREPLSDGYITLDSPPTDEGNGKALQTSEPETPITKGELSDNCFIEEPKYKDIQKHELSTDSKTLKWDTSPHSDATINTNMDRIERPTDGRTIMPNELKIKKHAEAVAARQQEVFGFMEDKEGKRYGSDDEANDADEFAGTHFHRLMTTRKSVWSLTGVFGIKIKSSTRAAAGFGPPIQTVRNRSRMRVPRPSPPQETNRSHESSGAVTESSDEDDLDRPTHRTSTSTRVNESQRPEVNRQTSRPEAPTVSKREKPEGLLRQRAERGKQLQEYKTEKPTARFKSKIQSLFDDLDELPESSMSNTTISKKKEDYPSPSDRVKDSSTENKLESKKSRSHNVPTFLL